jgi:endonuclease/exonuclease/phosphatase family metal-dependent hydrolase
MRSLGLCCGLWLAIAPGCSSNSGGGQPLDVTVDTFNIAMAGAFSPFEAERRPALINAIAQSPADVLCIQEAWRQSDKDAIINGAKSHFPNAVTFQNNLDTPTDALDSDCAVSPAPTAPPCADTAVQANMNASLQCLEQNCSTIPGSDQGVTTSTDCAQANCVRQAAALLLGGAAGLGCYGCVAPSLPSDTFASIANQCTTSINGGFAFGGQNGIILLSKYPLSGKQVYTFPSTWNRRVIVKATATLSNNATVDVYCNHTTSVFSGLTFPYTGRYGCGMTNADGWAHEQKLQIQKLISYVQQNSSGKALVLGDFNAGPAVNGPDGGAVVAEAGPNYDILAGAFVEAVPASYTKLCTFCPDNPIAGNTGPIWIDHIFLKGIPLTAVRSLQRTYTDRPVAVGADGGVPDGGPTSVTLSDHYGLRAVITIGP